MRLVVKVIMQMTAENSRIFNFMWNFFYFLAILLQDGIKILLFF